MRCDEIMKKDVECVSPSDSARTAARKMRDAEIGFLPVCGDDGKVMGTLTDRDLAIRLVAEDRGGDETIDRIMTNEVIACSPEDDLTEALRLMRENHKSRILMVDKEGRLQGVISLSDIAQVAEEEGAETLRAVSEREANP